MIGLEWVVVKDGEDGSQVSEDSSSEEKKEILSEVGVPPEEKRWQVNCGYKGWCFMQDPALSLMREAAAKGESTVAVNFRCEGKDWHYEIDLVNKTQRNLESEKIRKIREYDPALDKKVLSCHIRRLNPICLFNLGYASVELPIVLESRSTVSTLRIGAAGFLEHGGCVEPETVLFMKKIDGPGKFDGNHLVTLERKGHGFLCPSSSNAFQLDCCADSNTANIVFEVIPSHPRFTAARKLEREGNSTYGVALRFVNTGEFLNIDDTGTIVLAQPIHDDDAEQPAELLLIRYQPDADESWKQDSVYEGKRHWVLGSDSLFYTFEEFVAFESKKGLQVEPGCETGLIAAKVAWAQSVPQAASAEEFVEVQQLAGTMCQKAYLSWRDSRKYSFAELLTFIEARGKREDNPLELACKKWKKETSSKQAQLRTWHNKRKFEAGTTSAAR